MRYIQLKQAIKLFGWVYIGVRHNFKKKEKQILSYMNDERFHLEIPIENIRIERYEKTGGGESVKRLDYTEHGKKLREQTQSIKQNELSKRDSVYTSDLYLQISTPEAVTLKSQRLKIEELGFEVLSYSNTDKSTGTVKIKKEQLDTFEEKLDNYIESDDNIGKTYFSPIEEICSIPLESKIKAEIDLDSEEEVEIIINLFQALTPKEKLAINGVILNELKQFSKKVNHRNFINGITSIECKLQARHIPLIVSEFTTIKEIKPNQTFYVESSTPAEKIPDALVVRSVISESMICIIDSGISSAGGIFDNLIKQRQTQFLPTGSVDSDYEHGTFVASRCLFGDNIDDCLATNYLQPYCNVIDIPIFGIDFFGAKTYPTEFNLRSAIEDVVLQFHSTIKVYNLSLGAPDAIRDYEFTELAKLLDYLSKEYKILFVIAAGNIRRPLGDFPCGHFGSNDSRIGSPAESLLGLSVGSIAKYSNPNALSNQDFLSPFSRIGPGADLGIKPEVVAHGGNLIRPYTSTPRVSTYGISHNGISLAVDNGTSHSAPIISQYAQKLFDCYPISDPNLVKALLCHFSESRNIHDGLTENNSKYLGFGEPIIENALTAGENNAAYIYEGLLDQDNYQYVSFHIPSSLAAGMFDSKLKVKITIAYDPPVNPDNEIEYSKTRISAQLFKPTETHMKAINISGENKYNVPWNPIIQFEKCFSRSYFTGEWSLRLRLYTRGNLPANYLQDYSVVIEIIDTGNGTDVYSDIKNEFGELYKKIEIKIAV